MTAAVAATSMTRRRALNPAVHAAAQGRKHSVHVLRAAVDMRRGRDGADGGCEEREGPERVNAVEPST